MDSGICVGQLFQWAPFCFTLTPYDLLCLSLETLFTEEGSLMLLIHILAWFGDWSGDKSHLLFQESSLPWAACPGSCRCGARAMSGCCAGWWSACSALCQGPASHPQSLFRATSVPVNLMRAGTSTSSQFFSYLSLNKLWKWLSSPLNYFFWHKIHASGSTG